MKVHLPSPLVSYTTRRSVDAQGDSVGAVLRDLDRRFPGIEFRIVDEQRRVRRHIKIFVNGAEVTDLARSLRSEDEIHIVAALSGG
jgi:molybdopterin converting factor small subunit